MIGTSEFKRGVRIVVEGQPYTIEDFTVQTPSARGAATLVRVRLRHIVTGDYLERTFKAGERFEQPDVSFRRVQFLYSDGEACHFMDLESYEQFALPLDGLREEAAWLYDGLEATAVALEGRVVGIHMPQFVEAEVAMVGGGSRSDTATGRTSKDAVLTNGKTLKVPLFVEAGEKILVDTRTWEFARRADR